jgi:hypothetical protein
MPQSPSGIVPVVQRTASNAFARGTPRVVQPYQLQQVGSHSTAAQDYGTSNITQHARQLRGNNNDFSGVNYATFWVSVNGTSDQITASSGTYHSEKECWLALCAKYPVFKSLKVKSWPTGNYGGGHTPAQLLPAANTQITAVYTEREPCSGCAPLLNEIMPANAVVYWSFVYPSKETKKFEQPPEQVALFGLLNLGPSTQGVSYETTVDETVRKGRVIGNNQLKKSFNY